MKVEQFGKINTIFFDVGYTLIYPNPNYYWACEKIARSQGLIISEEKLQQGVVKAMSFYHAKTIEDMSIWADDRKIHDFFVGVFSQIFFHALSPIQQEFSQQQAEYLGSLVLENYHSKGHWSIFEDVIPTLTQLKKQGYILGIYSDWWSELPKLLIELELDKYFQHLYTSSSLRMAKRQNGAFEKLVRVSKIDPLKTVFIGDSIELDISPAQLIGMKAIWLNRDNKNVPEGVNSINSLSELYQFI